MDIKGSGSITDLADNVFAVWRNKDKAPNEPGAVLQCDKQRNGEWKGKVPLWFDLSSFHYLETEHAKVTALIQPDDLPGDSAGDTVTLGESPHHSPCTETAA